MRRAITLSMLSLLAGCAPQLTEGRYGCADDACPPGWFCHADDVCRSTPELPADAAAASGDAGPGTDAATGGGDLAPCTSTSDCASGSCYRGAADEWATGFCSQRCTDADETRCDLVSGLALCGENDVCALYCGDTDPTCIPDYGCVAVFRDEPGGGILGECMPNAYEVPAAGGPCGAGCPSGFDCAAFGGAAGVCARPCVAGMRCGTGEMCRVTNGGRFACAP